MNNGKRHSEYITNRFFDALAQIIAKKELRGIQTFTNRYGIDKRNFYKVKKDPEHFNLNYSWVYYLVNDFNVSAEWLITGKGKTFKQKYTAKILQ